MRIKKEMKKIIEIISVILIFIGVAISFLEIKGWFPNPRLELSNKIMNLRENILPFNTPHVDELLLAFLPAQNPNINKSNLNTTLRDYEGIVIENLTIDSHDTFGSVRIQHKDGVRTVVICGLQELKDWADSGNQYVKWIGWGLASLGAFISLVSLFVKEKEIDKKT